MVIFMMEEIKKEILQIVSVSDYKKGMNYEESYIEYINTTNFLGSKRLQFLVESESSYRKYMVQIETKNNQISTVSCTCPKFLESDSCKHVAACLITYSDKIFVSTSNVPRKSLIVLNNLKEQFTHTKNKKEEVFIYPYIAIENSYYRNYVVIKAKIGQKKMYSLIGKFGAFRDAYQRGQKYSFGANFVYDPEIHYFSEQSLAFLQILELLRKFYHSNGNSIYVDDTIIKQLFKLYPDGIYMENPDRLVKVKNEFPFKTLLSREKGDYHLKIEQTDSVISLTSDDEYVLYNQNIYHLTKEQQNLFSQLIHFDMDEMILPEQDFGDIQKHVLRLVKDQIELDESVKDLVIVSKPDVKFYFDFYEDSITCDVKFTYQDQEVSYFENPTNILKDNEFEEECVTVLEKYGFVKGNKIFLLDDFDLECEFLDSGLEEIAAQYPVFTSEKVQSAHLLKNVSASSTFRIGKDNILRYEFNLEGVNDEELDQILASLKRKKKYYRLKNGDIVSLESESLKQLNELSEELELTEENGVIPKYRALYLDSLKKEKYGIIKTDSIFENFIKQFQNFKNIDISFTNEELNILRDYQKDGVKWLYTIYKCGFGGILADEMGLGKSLQTIYFLRKLLLEDENSKFLIVCPTSLVYNWESEFQKFAPEITYHVFAESKEKRHEELTNFTGSVFITSYGLLREDLSIYQEKSFKVFIIDEAQNIKNPKTGLTKAVKSITAEAKMALTGTPIENSIVELWSIFDFIMPGFLSTLMKFQQKYKVKDFDEESTQLLNQLKKQVRPFILRRKKADVVKDLPAKIENNIYIDLTEEQKKIYAAEVKSANDEMTRLIQEGGFTKNKMIILSLLTRLRQICISPEILLKDYQGESSKIENLIKIIKELVLNGHKILLFTSFKTALNLVKDALDEENISSYTIAGDVSASKRKMLVDVFNKDQTNVFLIMLKSGGTGLNLTSADVVIHLDLWWNPQAENQATDRTHRIGQTKTVEVIKLICKGTIEEKILDLQQKKKLLSDSLIEGDMDDTTILKNLTEKDIRNLLSYENKD